MGQCGAERLNEMALPLLWYDFLPLGLYIVLGLMIRRAMRSK
jgi:hypothetical protein